VEEVYYNCLRCKNKKVRILTMDGNQYEGVIMDVDRNNVYLKTERKGKGKVKTSAFYPYGGGFGNEILTLSLFTLLAIALI
jgi:small nuclear ribonucleoprotein (snRNP)-like protein